MLYCACARPVGCTDVFISHALDARHNKSGRLEFVRLWASEVHGDAVDVGPVPGLPVSVSPRDTDEVGNTTGCLVDWLKWAICSDGWAAAAVHALAARRVRAGFEYSDAVHYSARVALAAFLASFATAATLAATGSAYLNHFARCSAPGYVTALSGRDSFLDVGAAIPETINEIVGPTVHTTVSEQFKGVVWTKWTAHDFLLAVAVIGEAAPGVKVYVNGDLLGHAGDAPAFFIFHDFDTDIGEACGVVHRGRLYHTNNSTSPILDAIGYWLMHTPAHAAIHRALTAGAPPPARLRMHIK